jgi:hypothetical protein
MNTKVCPGDAVLDTQRRFTYTLCCKKGLLVITSWISVSLRLPTETSKRWPKKAVPRGSLALLRCFSNADFVLGGACGKGGGELPGLNPSTLSYRISQLAIPYGKMLKKYQPR